MESHVNPTPEKEDTTCQVSPYHIKYVIIYVICDPLASSFKKSYGGT